MPFTFFILPNSLASTSSTILNRSKEGILVLFLILEEILIVVHHWVCCSLSFSVNGFYYVKVASSYCYFFFFKCFSGKCVKFCQVLFLYQMRYSCGLFPFHSVDVAYYTDFHVEPAFLCRSKLHLVMVSNPLNMLPNSVSQ